MQQPGNHTRPQEPWRLLQSHRHPVPPPILNQVAPGAILAQASGTILAQASGTPVSCLAGSLCKAADPQCSVYAQA
jgi:hypothetical protein